MLLQDSKNTARITNPKNTKNRLTRWIVCSTALLSFAAGSLMVVDVTHADETKLDSNRVFELLIYHTLPGKAPALESVFREASKVMAKHGINVVGFWVPNEDPAWKDTFIYVVAHPSREEAKRNWDALHGDTAFRPYIEAAKPLLDKVGKVFRVDEVYMRPTDFSPMK
jgi:NIPSNAP